MTLNLSDPAFLAVAGNRPLWTFANVATSAWHSGVSGITASAGLVSQWNDRKGAGPNYTAAGTARPTVVSNAQNGRSILRFNGTTNVMGSASAALLRGLSGATIVAAVRRTANLATEATVLGIATSVVNTRANLGFRSASTANEGIFTGGRRAAANPFQPVGASPYSPQFIIVVAVFDYLNATLRLRENGAETAFRVFQESGTTENDAGAIFIGANAAGTGAFFNGDLAELAIIPFAADTALCQQAEGYVGHEWALNSGLAVNHPFLTFPPYQ
jgi:hypothetical protein